MTGTKICDINSSDFDETCLRDKSEIPLDIREAVVMMMIDPGTNAMSIPTAPINPNIELGKTCFTTRNSTRSLSRP